MIKFIAGMFLFLSVVSLIVLGGYSYYLSYQYESKIGAYFDNARDSITPEAILIQLESGKQAMIEEGLTEDMYGAWIFKKPDNSMKFQYQHLDGIIERAEAVKEWKEATYSGSATTTENFGDVYNTKMDNLRNYIHAEFERSDWIAEDTWYLKNHFLYTVSVEWLAIIISLIAVISLFVLVSQG